MQHRKNQMSMSSMVGRCHHWRQKRKQFMDQARMTADEIERERMLQMAEHYGRIVNDEQSKIDTRRDGGAAPAPDGVDEGEDEEFQDFKTK